MKSAVVSQKKSATQGNCLLPQSRIEKIIFFGTTAKKNDEIGECLFPDDGEEAQLVDIERTFRSVEIAILLSQANVFLNRQDVSTRPIAAKQGMRLGRSLRRRQASLRLADESSDGATSADGPCSNFFQQDRAAVWMDLDRWPMASQLGIQNSGSCI